MIYLHDEQGRLFSALTLTPAPVALMDARVAAHIEGNNAAGAVFFEGDPAAHYVQHGEVLPRPANPARRVGMSLADLPAPCLISIGGQDYVCTDTVAELEFDQPGRYEVTVSAWPHTEKRFEIENPAQ